jgi:hypothetical protein
MKDLNWMYMLDVLSGEKFSNFGLQKMAEINIGKVTQSRQYTLLTESPVYANCYGTLCGKVILLMYIAIIDKIVYNCLY